MQEEVKNFMNLFSSYLHAAAEEIFKISHEQILIYDSKMTYEGERQIIKLGNENLVIPYRIKLSILDYSPYSKIQQLMTFSG